MSDDSPRLPPFPPYRVLLRRIYARSFWQARTFTMKRLLARAWWKTWRKPR